MRISMQLVFDHDPKPAITTGVEGAVADMLIPTVGDLVQHRVPNGDVLVGRVKNRVFAYELGNGIGVDGSVTVTLMLDPVRVQ